MQANIEKNYKSHSALHTRANVLAAMCAAGIACQMGLPLHKVWGEAPDTLAPIAEAFDDYGDSVLVKPGKSAGHVTVAKKKLKSQSGLEPESIDTDDEPELAADMLSLEEIGPTVADEETNDFGAGLSEARERRIARRENNSQLSSVSGSSQVAKFNGIQPGTSSVDDVMETWGEPIDILDIEDGEVLIFEAEPFRQIDAVISQGTVETLKIELETQLSAKRLAKQLRLTEIEPAMIYDEQGRELGQIYPEKGVLFMFVEGVADPDDLASAAAAQNLVSHIVIEPLDPVAFTLRAENNLHGPYEQNISDLNQALALEQDMDHAHWLLAEVHMATGQANLAEKHAAKAFQLDPGNDAYRLRWARTLENLARYDEAVEETRAVLDGENLAPIVKAQALYQMGRLATLGGADIRAKAIPFLNRSIEIADQVATSDDIFERLAAKELLVDAHLAIAREVAAQDYNKKVDALSQWIERASGLAEDAIANEGGSLELRLRVAEAALASLADLKPTKDPEPWIEEAQSAASELLTEYDDVLWQRRIQWQLGSAYFHALRTEHTRRKTSAALAYSQQAIDYLAEGAKSRQAVPDSEHLVGRLYFHIGAIHAVHEKDHDKAAIWYDKAVPLLTTDVPVTQLAVPRRHGEALVSMGVTYWQQGKRREALKLTQAGADLVEDAVTCGVLDKGALAVPYGNLATMHKDLGNEDRSAKYADLAKAARAAKKPTESAPEDEAVSSKKPASQGQVARQRQPQRRSPTEGASSQGVNRQSQQSQMTQRSLSRPGQRSSVQAGRRRTAGRRQRTANQPKQGSDGRSRTARSANNRGGFQDNTNPQY